MKSLRELSKKYSNIFGGVLRRGWANTTHVHCETVKKIHHCHSDRAERVEESHGSAKKISRLRCASLEMTDTAVFLYSLIVN